MRFLKVHVVHLLFTNKTSRKFSWGTFFYKVNANLWMPLCKVMYFQSIMPVDNVSRYVDKDSNKAFQTHQITKAENFTNPCWTVRAEGKQSCCVFWGATLKFFRRFPHFLHENTEAVPQLRPYPLPFTSFLIHYEFVMKITYFYDITCRPVNSGRSRDVRVFNYLQIDAVLLFDICKCWTKKHHCL